ncbi:ArsR/SmtB family transcription factor [Halorussus marinus]|uniref:ArsR/SmtB family transcription factor n=1 Tax=Halorussus marinus TaxID=2505976 RepID=UPI00106E7370|nr:helix-turn-helix domain-containing protein [Halorussus marinus]
MAGLLPSSSDAEADDGDPRVIGVDSEEADVLLGALQSETARDVLAALYDEPRTPSALAEAADTSIQNVRYHLRKLEDADLVEVVDTIYSEKGREMSVYAPAAAPLVVFAGSDEDAPGVESALSRLLGALGILGLASLLVQGTVGGGLVPRLGSGSGGDAGAAPTAAENATAGGDADYRSETVTESAEATPAPESTAHDGTVAEESVRTVAEATESADGAGTVADTVAQSTTTAVEAAGSAAGGPPPGLVFFVGGAVALAALGAAWYVRTR